VALLVGALNRCWLPYFPGEPAVTPEAFKRSIRDLQVWCSSCMVAFAGADPIGVLIGAKRPWGTLIQRIAVHPGHRRQGHGRHLLESLSSKLSILGPPRLFAEVPETLDAPRELFRITGYAQEALLTDWTLDAGESATVPAGGGPRDGHDAPAPGFVIPVTVDDLAANGLLEGDAGTRVCWERSMETLTARKDGITGFAVASDERIEAYLLYAGGGAAGTEIVALRSMVDDGGARLTRLLLELRARGTAPYRFPKVHPAEVPTASLERLGFRAGGGHLRYETTARVA
jgi:GNAT superfamily N-acetyltransferase